MGNKGNKKPITGRGRGGPFGSERGKGGPSKSERGRGKAGEGMCFLAREEREEQNRQNIGWGLLDLVVESTRISHGKISNIEELMSLGQ